MVQQMVDKAWALIAKFDDLERQLKGTADDKTLSAEGAKRRARTCPRSAMPCSGGHGSPHRQIRLPGMM